MPAAVTTQAKVTKAVSTLSVNSSNDSGDASAMTGVYANASIMQLIMALLGREVVVRTRDERIFKGLLDSISQEFEVALVMAHEVASEETVDSLPRHSEMISTLVFKYSEIVTLQGDAKLDKPHVTGFACDKDYSNDPNNTSNGGDDLSTRWNRMEEWAPDGDDDDAGAEEEHATWDVHQMFTSNQRLGVESTYVEEMTQYSNADIGHMSEAERRRAAQIAADIESDPRSRRAQALENDDEERDIIMSHRGGMRGGRGRGGVVRGARGGALARGGGGGGFNEWAARRQSQPVGGVAPVKTPTDQPAGQVAPTQQQQPQQQLRQPSAVSPVASPARQSNDVRQTQQQVQRQPGSYAGVSKPASQRDQLRQFHDSFQLVKMPADPSHETAPSTGAAPNAWQRPPNMSVPPPNMANATSSTVDSSTEHKEPTPPPNAPPMSMQSQTTPTQSASTAEGSAAAAAAHNFKFNPDAAVFTPKVSSSTPSITQDVTQPAPQQQVFEQPPQQMMQQQQQPMYAFQPPPPQAQQPLHISTMPPTSMQQQVIQQGPGGQQYVLQAQVPQFMGQPHQQITAAQVIAQQQRVMQPPPYMHPMQQQGQQPARIVQHRGQPTSTHMVTGQPLMATGATSTSQPMLVMATGGQPQQFVQHQMLPQYYAQQQQVQQQFIARTPISHPPPPTTVDGAPQQFVYPVMQMSQPPPLQQQMSVGNGTDSAHVSQPPTPGPPMMMQAPSPAIYSPHPQQQYIMVPQQFQQQSQGTPGQPQMVVQQQSNHDMIIQQQLMQQQQRMSGQHYMQSPPNGPPPQQQQRPSTAQQQAPPQQQ